MSEPNKRPIDCVEMKRRAQEQILRETQGMTPEQELEYWRDAERSLAARIEAARGKRKAS